MINYKNKINKQTCPTLKSRKEMPKYFQQEGIQVKELNRR
jgi:hypothetical protein